MKKIDKIFLFNAISVVLLLVIFGIFLLLSCIFSDTNGQILIQIMFMLGLFLLILIPISYILSLVIFSIKLFSENKVKKDYIILFFELVYVGFMFALICICSCAWRVLDEII